MIKLNKIQLVITWIISLSISCLILLPVIKITRLYRYEYETTDGWRIRNETSRFGELQDKDGRYYLPVADLSSDELIKNYYYEGSHKKYSLNMSKHPYERFIIIIILSGILLIYTLGRKKKIIIQSNEKDKSTKDEQKQ